MNSWNNDEIVKLCAPSWLRRSHKLGDLIVVRMFDIVDLEPEKNPPRGSNWIVETAWSTSSSVLATEFQLFVLQLADFRAPNSWWTYLTAIGWFFSAKNNPHPDWLPKASILNRPVLSSTSALSSSLIVCELMQWGHGVRLLCHACPLDPRGGLCLFQ